jgi:hemerythrin superfamily protein
MSPLVRAALQPQTVRLPFNGISASSRVHVAAISTITEAITSDHREIKDAYNQVVNSNDVDHQTRYGNQFTWELARHSIAEELIVYPAFEKYLGKEGKVMADNDRKQHHRVSAVVESLVKVSLADSPLFRSRNISRNSKT